MQTNLKAFFLFVCFLIKQVNTGDSLLRPDNIAGIPYSGAVLLVFCFPMVLWRLLMLFSSALKTFPMLLKCCFSFSE